MDGALGELNPLVIHNQAAAQYTDNVLNEVATESISTLKAGIGAQGLFNLRRAMAIQAIGGLFSAIPEQFVEAETGW